MPCRPRLRRSAPRLVAGALLAAAGTFAPVAAAPVAAAPVAAAPVAAAPVPTVYAQPAGLVADDQLAPLRLEQAWQHASGRGVTVAVLDSGVDASHPALAGRVEPGADYVDGSTDGRTDSVGHGTTVASLIIGEGAGTTIGLAPEATILPVRVLDDDNRYQSAATVAEGVIWAVDQGAEVINLSLGGDRPSLTLGEALAYAMANDVVVVACTGNVTAEPGAQVWYPAREPGVVGVAGLTWGPDGTPQGWSESLTGPETVLAAPAVVSGAQAGGGNRAVQGTSFSSAIVAGTAALIRSRWPELSAGDVVNRLVASAADAGTPGRDPIFGFGVVDPVAALTEAVPSVPTNPLDTKARHGLAGFGSAPDGPPPVAGTESTPTVDPSDDQIPGQPAGGAVQPTATGGGRDDVPPARLVIAIGFAAAALGLLALILLVRLGHRSAGR